MNTSTPPAETNKVALPAVREIIILARGTDAGQMRFRVGDHRHRDDDSIMVWWPDLGLEVLRGLKGLRRVTVTKAAVEQIISSDLPTFLIVQRVLRRLLRPRGVWLQL